jgi:heat shock protein HslJ
MNGHLLALGLAALLGLSQSLSGCTLQRPEAGTEAAIADAPGMAPIDLEGTHWILEDLANTGVVDRAEATLSFGEAGAVNGRGSCNRFAGPVTIKGDAIAFGALAATRMACPEAVMNQENRYFDALASAYRYELDGPYLYVYFGEQAAPLRFIAADPVGRP